MLTVLCQIYLAFLSVYFKHVLKFAVEVTGFVTIAMCPKDSYASDMFKFPNQHCTSRLHSWMMLYNYKDIM